MQMHCQKYGEQYRCVCQFVVFLGFQTNVSTQEI
jgi:hypothetical protein